MAIPFATMDELKASLRILPTETDDDALLSLLLMAASKSVANYLKSAAGPLLAVGADIPPEVVVSTIMLVGYLYRSPDQDPDRYFEPGYLPAPVTALLYPLRDPAVA
ncbi:head-tail connector protein [Agrobacterium tumefaciens]|uniref:head-tail connector protein n=1 Tax=Agrobacterium tumefaciens TaxID=358 RepID=UPI003B9EEB87